MPSGYRRSSKSTSRDHSRLEWPFPFCGCARTRSNVLPKLAKSILWLFVVVDVIVGSQAFVTSKRTPSSQSNPSLSEAAFDSSPSIARASAGEISSADMDLLVIDTGSGDRPWSLSFSMKAEELNGAANKDSMMGDLEVRGWSGGRCCILVGVEASERRGRGSALKIQKR